MQWTTNSRGITSLCIPNINRYRVLTKKGTVIYKKNPKAKQDLVIGIFLIMAGLYILGHVGVFLTSN